MIYGNEFYERFINDNWKECKQYIPYHKLLMSLWAYSGILLNNNIIRRDEYLDFFIKKSKIITEKYVKENTTK